MSRTDNFGACSRCGKGFTYTEQGAVIIQAPDGDVCSKCIGAENLSKWIAAGPPIAQTQRANRAKQTRRDQRRRA